MKSIFFLLLATLFCQEVVGQVFSEKQALGEVQLGDRLISEERYVEAGQAYRRALPYFQKKGDCYWQSYLFLWLGEAAYQRGDYHQAITLGTQSKDMAESCLRADTLQFYSLILQNLGVFYSRVGDFNRQMDYYRQSFRQAIRFHGRESPQAADAYLSIGSAYGRINQWESSIAYWDTSLQISQQIDYNDGVATALLNLSYAYWVKKDLAKAIDLQRRALQLTTSKGELASGNNNLGMLYYDLGELDRALEHLYLALNIRKSMESVQVDDLAGTMLNIARCHLDLGDLKKGNTFLDEAISLLDQAPPQSRGLLKVAYHYKAYQALNYGRLPEAERYARKALEVADPQLNLSINSRLVIAHVFLAQDRIEEGLDQVQKALSDLIRGFSPRTIYDNPSVSEIENVNLTLDLLSMKARLLCRRGELEGSQGDLSESLNTYLLSDSLIVISRRTYQDNTSKEMLSADARSLYAGAIEAGYQLYRLSDDDAYLDLVFPYSEKSKSLLVLEKLHDLYAKAFSGIPREVVDRERTLLREIEFYSNQIRSYRNVVPLPPAVADWESRLFDLRMEQEALLEQLREQYPEYYYLKHNLTAATPDEIQANLLQPDEVLIEYFLAGDRLYIFLVGREMREFFEIPLEVDFQNLVQSFRQSIIHQDEAFYAYSFKLYQLLIQPLEELLEGKELIIVPDGVLGYVPFEVLLSRMPEREEYDLHRQLPYLLRKYPMRYSFSASLALRQNERLPFNGRGRVLAVAPEFTDSVQFGPTGRALAPLEGGNEEVDILRRRFRGDFWQGEALESRFKQDGGHYRLIHIVTHTLLDDRFPSLSKLIFSEGDSLDDGLLNAYELYNLNLNAELVTLSACNTGFGKILDGEGIASLARAFAYAGAPNLVMSLWPVKDKTTPMIMEKFYQYLEEGMAKGEALQKAKLHYLDKSRQLYLHPYYWGTFIYVGNQAPIHLEMNRKVPVSAWLLLIGMGLLLLGALWYIKKRRHTPAVSTV